MSTDKKKNKKTFLIITITAYLVIAGFMIYRAQQSPGTCPFLSLCGSSTTKETAKAEPVTTVEKEMAKEIKLPTLLELGSKSCEPCQMMEPILEKLTKEYAGVLKVEFIDVWLKENTNIGIKYKINSIPVQIFFDAEGKEIWRHVGYIPEDDILRQWKKLGYDLPALKKNKK